MPNGKWTRHIILATCLALLMVVALGDLAQAQQFGGSIFEKMPAGLSAKEQQAYREEVCSNPPLSADPVPQDYFQFCGDQTAQIPTNLEPDTQRGPIITQDAGHTATGLGTTSVATIGTLTSFGALVIPDFPADLEVLQTDLQNAYQITSAGVTSRYNSSGVNSGLPNISPPAGQSWTDLAVDPTTGVVYGVSSVCGTSSTLSTLNLTGGTSAVVGVIRAASSCIVGLAADNTGNLWGYDIVNDTLISINKVTGLGTIVGPIGFNANFGQSMDCDPSSGTCYMFAFNATAGRPELRSVNLVTGATTLIGVIGATSPGAGVQVSGGVFATIGTCTVNADCDDGNPCNGVETCQAPNCVPGTPIVCNDGLFCTLDSCNPANGQCVTVPNPCSDGNGCNVDTCDEASDTCLHTPGGAPVQFCNSGNIQITATGSSGISSPYPSSIAVAGIGGSSLCSVEIRGYRHTFPDDVDTMLVGPAGGAQNRTIMSDVGGSADLLAPGINLVLRDDAAGPLPDAGPLVAGTFRPTNIDTTSDAFAAPAPAPTGLAPLGPLFENINPNGTWNLFVWDDAGGDTGAFANGWCLNFIVSACTIDADCSDGQACNGSETCVGGTCQPGTPVNCDDGDFCTTDTCVNPAGTCNHAPVVCNDNNVCTDDTCVSSGPGCVFTNNTAPCSDNNPCTTGDICAAGSCVPGGPTNCDDANDCTTDSCSPPTGCTHVASAGGPCSDGNPCTENDVCQLPCNGTFSENFDGVVAPALPAGWSTQLVTGQAGDIAWRTAASTDTPPNGGNTDDPSHVTDKVLNSTVLPAGAAQVTFRNSFTTEASPPSYYDGGVLEIKIGAGPFQDVIAAGGSFVTGGYTGAISTTFSSPIAGRMAWSGNSGGFITTTVNLPPSSAGQPTILRWRFATDVSVSSTGQTIDTITVVTCSSVCSGVPGSSPCDDGNPCTTNDTCGGGSCHGGPPPDCNDNNPCTDDSCDPGSGCVHSPNTNPCDDGNACTTNDTCGGGTCNGGPPPNCNDGNVCTDDSCDPGTGCVNTNNTGPCNDGNSCTTNDTCGGGSCHGGAAPDCNDGNVCTDDSCDPASGCVNTSNNSCNTKGQGYWKRLCHGPHSGDFYTQFDVDCVNNTCTFASVATVADLCDRLDANPSSDKCERAEVSFMSLVLNLCRQRVLPSQSINSRCGDHQTAGESRSIADAALCDPDRTGDDCLHAECASTEVVSGEALWANSLRIQRESSGIRLTWEPPYSNPDTLTPRKYRIYRKSELTAPFVQIGEVNGGILTYLDAQAAGSTTPYVYEIISNW